MPIRLTTLFAAVGRGTAQVTLCEQGRLGQALAIAAGGQEAEDLDPVWGTILYEGRNAQIVHNEAHHVACQCLYKSRGLYSF